MSRSPDRSPSPAPRRSPQAEAERSERLARLPPGTDERFVGYGVLGLTFSSGHILGLRRWPASSIGPAYTSVWHRSPAGRWQLFTDVAEIRSCSRYISAMMREAHTTAIRLAWLDPWRFRVDIGSADFRWDMQLRATPLTAGFAMMRGLVTDRLASSDRALRLLERLARTGLGTGPIRLRGLMPNGQQFRIIPRRIWMIESAVARLGGTDLGVPGPLTAPARLGDLVVPECGMLTFATARFG